MSYWAGRYTETDAILHHALQNQRISNDFMREARTRESFLNALSSREIIEVGCGTGELASLIKNNYGTAVYYATDSCREAVKLAQHRFPAINFWLHDILKDPPPRQFDLLVCSNTLEHFRDTGAVIEKMFLIAPLLLLLIPYDQPVTDGYEAEGGAGHAVQLNAASFDEWMIKDSFLFQTSGWQHSSDHEEPLQMALLLTR